MRKYYIWIVLCLSYIVVFFHRFMAGAVKDDLIREFDISLTVFSSLGAMYFYAYVIMQIPSGLLVDYMGPKKTATIGIFLAGLSSIAFGISPNVQYAFIFRLLVGIGVSVIYICILKILTNWFSEKRFATMSGLTAAIGNIGALLAQSPLVILAYTLGWRNSFVLVGGATILIGFITMMVVSNSPSGQFETKLPAKQELIGAIWGVVKNKYTWPPFIMYTLFFGAFFALTGTWGISYLSTVYNIDAVDAGNYTMIPILGLTVGAAFLGMISDKLKKRRLPVIFLGIIYLCTWGLLVFLNSGKPPIEWIPTLFFMIGLTCSAFTLVWACGKEVNDPKFAGISTSIVNIGGFIGAIILPFFMSVFLQFFQEIHNYEKLYQGAFIICFISVLIGVLASFFIKETHCQNCFSKKL